MSAGSMTILGTAEVIRRTGLTRAQLGYWDRTGFLSPSIIQASGRGSRRYYSEQDVRYLVIGKALLDLGLELRTGLGRTLRGLLAAMCQDMPTLLPMIGAAVRP